MDELPLNRASNPFKNQGYMLRLARQRGGGMLGRRSSGHRRHRRQRRCQRVYLNTCSQRLSIALG